MTTIVLGSVSASWDNQITINDTSEQTAIPKVFYDDVLDMIVAIAGAMSAATRVWKALREGADLDDVVLTDHDHFEIVLITREGLAYSLGNGELQPVPIAIPYAMGSGAKFAKAVMHSMDYVEASVEHACKIACELDVYSGRFVTTQAYGQIWTSKPLSPPTLGPKAVKKKEKKAK